ncbi:hypothetical protein ACTXT7_012617 [Hymenolepis weldensis]
MLQTTYMEYLTRCYFVAFLEYIIDLKSRFASRKRESYHLFMESFSQSDWWTVGMYGLMSVFQAFGSLCHRLRPREPCLREGNVYLISAVPPPIERKFRPLIPIQTSRVFSVSDSVNPSSSPLHALSSPNLPLDDIKFVKTAAFVSNGIPGNAQQYPEGTAFVLSTEPSQPFCTSNSEHAEFESNEVMYYSPALRERRRVKDWDQSYN